MKIRRHLLPLLLASAPFFAQAECQPDRAHYELKGDANWQVGFLSIPHFKGWLSDLAFYVESKKEQRVFWFLFDRGSARYTNLISTTDIKTKGWLPPDPDGGNRPLGDSHFFALDSNLMTIETMPMQASEAPPYIFLPDLPELMWYRAEPRLSAPGGIFVLKDCP